MSGFTYFGERAAAELDEWQNAGRKLTFAEPLPDGGSGARMAICHHEGDEDHPAHKLLLKLCAPDEGSVREPRELEAAWSSGPNFSKGARTFEFPDRRLVHSVYPPLRVGDTWLMFLEVALDDRMDHELTPLNRIVSLAERTKVAEAVVRSVLTEWNPDSGADHRMTAHQFIDRALGHRAAPGSRLTRAAAEILGTQVHQPQIVLPGWPESLPNPVLFSEDSPLAGLKPPTVALGRAHYDLHPGNIMVETDPLLVADAHRLVDLSRFQEKGLLARDPVHLMLCLVCDYLGELSDRALNDLAAVLLRKDHATEQGEDLLPVGLHRTVRLLRSAPSSWREKKRYTLDDWHPQYLLALQACALMFVARREDERERVWFLRLAARACAAFQQVAELVSRASGPSPTAARVPAATQQPSAGTGLKTALGGGTGEAVHTAPPRARYGSAAADAPRVWGRVPRRNTRFTGRRPLLDRTHQLLHATRPGSGTLALHGMLGVGKTQLAVEYVYSRASEYDVVWWVDGATRSTYREGLAGLCDALELRAGREYGERIRAVLDALRRSTPHGRWLLVVDGADEPDDISDLIPEGPGHVLITSRNQEWGEHNTPLLEVPAFGRDESSAFVRRRAPRLTEAEAGRLAEAVEDLPLLLDQTAGWLNGSDLTVGEYVGLAQAGFDHHVVKVSADYPETFQTSWARLLGKLQERAPDSYELLKLASAFAPGPIPVRLLSASAHKLPGPAAGLVSDRLVWSKAVRVLLQYSVITLTPREDTGPDPSSSSSRRPIHLAGTVRQAVRTDMPTAARRELIETARQALATADPQDPLEPGRWDVYQEIVGQLHAADVLNSWEPDVQRLVLNCLDFLWFTGRHEQGLALADRALACCQVRLEAGHPQFRELVDRFTRLLRATGNYQSAESWAGPAAGPLREDYGADDMSHLRAVAGHAADLRGLGRYNEALDRTRHVYAAYRDLVGELDSRTLDAQSDVGVCLRLRGRYAEALENDRNALRTRRLMPMPHDPWKPFYTTSCAIDLRLLGRYGEAESLQSEAAAECRDLMGADHPQTLRAEHNLALCRVLIGDRERGIRLLAEVVDRSERARGEIHPETLMFATSQSCFPEEDGEPGLASEKSALIVARYEEMLPAGHPFVSGARANHALMLWRVGEREEAHVLMERALADMMAAVGAGHPWTLGCDVNLSALLSSAGDVESARDLSEDTVARATQALGPTHLLTLAARVAHAEDLRRLRDVQRAATVERSALEDLTATLGAEHRVTVAAHRRSRPLWTFEPLES